MALVIPSEEGIPVPQSISKHLPVVSMVNPCKGKGVHFLAPDEEETGRTAVKYLYERGHRRILHLTYLNPRYAVKARARGYRQQAREMKLQPHVVTGLDRESLARGMKAGRPTALFCHNDWLALTAMLLLSERGIRVPEDISVLGVDNSPTWIAINPHLTTLAYPMESFGQAVLDILDGKPGAIARDPLQIIERKTVRSI